MAVLALAAVGAGIGASIGGTFLGMSAAGIGWMAGSYVGQLVTAKGQHSDGPRLGDLSVQASTYGGARPIIYGSMRVAGNVIFCTDKRERATTEQVGGKGGPSVTSTTYTYDVDMAVALCEGPITGISKIWSDGELIYDISSTSTIESIVAGTLQAPEFTVYLGTESQMPDPVIEATVGAGLTPAYRGTAYVVFERLDCPGGRIPQLTFEVVSAGAATGGMSQTFPDPMLDRANAVEWYGSVCEEGGYVYYRPSTTDNSMRRVSLVGINFEQTDLPHRPNVIGNQPIQDNIWPVQGGPYLLAVSRTGSWETVEVWAYDLRDGSTRLIHSRTGGVLSSSPFGIGDQAYDPITDKFAARGRESTNSWNVRVWPGNVMTPTLDAPLGGASAQGPLAFYNNIIYVVTRPSGNSKLDMYDGSTGALIGSISSGVVLDQDFGRVQICANRHGVFVREYGGGNRLWRISGGAWNLLASNIDGGSGRGLNFYANRRYAVFGPLGSAVTNQVWFRIIVYGAIAAQPADVASVIQDICARAGLTATNTTGITDTVPGYAITRVSSARSALEPLQQAFFIDGVERDAAMRFFKRAQQTVEESIPFDELGAVEQGGESPDAFALTRAQEAEMPRSLALNYLNTEADYQPGTETARRQITGSTMDAVVELPIASTPGHMASVAAALLYEAWAARNTRKATVSRRYARLQEGDFINVEFPRGTTTQCRIHRAVDTGSLIELEMVPAQPSLSAVVAPGASASTSQTVGLISRTALAVLDIPLLRDADDSPGVYAALAGYGSRWNGAVLYEGSGEWDMVARGMVSSPATMGTTLNALGSFTSSRLVDEVNTLTVAMNSGELSSITHDAMLSSEANVIVVGAEIIQFRSAENLGSGQYRLSGLRRGLRGTEWAIGTHAIGERVVLLQVAGMLRVGMNATDANTSRSYMAVSVGMDASTGTRATVTNVDAGRRPLAPANLDVAYDGAGNYRLRWVRRTRYADNWLAGSVPLGEAAESYSIDVTTAGVTTTYTASTPTVTLALGTGSLAGTVISVFQVSATAGRGFPATLTL
jgi:hypothetical protein